MHYVGAQTPVVTCIIIRIYDCIEEKINKLHTFFCKHFKKFTKFNKHTLLCTV